MRETTLRVVDSSGFCLEFVVDQALSRRIRTFRVLDVPSVRKVGDSFRKAPMSDREAGSCQAALEPRAYGSGEHPFGEEVLCCADGTVVQRAEDLTSPVSSSKPHAKV